MMPPQLGLRRGAVSRRSGLRAAFNPANELGLILWLDATLGITTSSGNITEWVDQSSYGHVFTADTTGPIYDATGFNGFPCADYPGGARSMSCPDSDAFTSSDGYTILIAGSIDGIASRRTLLSNRGAGALGTVAGFRALEVDNNGANYEFLMIDDGTNYRTTENEVVQPTQGQNYIWSITMENAALTLREDNVATALSWTTTSGTVGTVNSTSRLYLGSRDGSSQHWDGLVAEMVAYNRILPAATLTNAYNYMADRYGL